MPKAMSVTPEQARKKASRLTQTRKALEGAARTNLEASVLFGESFDYFVQDYVRLQQVTADLSQRVERLEEKFKSETKSKAVEVSTQGNAEDPKAESSEGNKGKEANVEMIEIEDFLDEDESKEAMSGPSIEGKAQKKKRPRRKLEANSGEQDTIKNTRPARKSRARGTR